MMSAGLIREQEQYKRVTSTNIGLTIIHGERRSIDGKSHVQYLKWKASNKQLLMNENTYCVLRTTVRVHPNSLNPTMHIGYYSVHHFGPPQNPQLFPKTAMVAWSTRQLPSIVQIDTPDGDTTESQFIWIFPR